MGAYPVASLWLCASCSLLWVPVAVDAAEEPPRGETVMQRPRPEITPLGLSIGEFLVLPRLSLAGAYDDNLLAEDVAERSGFRSEISPEVEVRSDWGNHALNLLANADIGQNSEFGSEDYEDWAVSTDGQLDVLRTVRVYAGAGGGHDHVERTSPEDSNGIEPTQFDFATAFGRYVQQFGRFSLQVNTEFDRNDFQDVLGVRNGIAAPINQDDRDRTEYRLGVRGGYEILRDYEAYLRVTNNRREYDDLLDISNTDRSSDGYEAVAGVALDLGGVVFGDVYLGYWSQDYAAPFPDIETPVFGTSLFWNPSGLTTVSVGLQRSINEAVNIQFSGYTSTETSFAVDHELRRDLLLRAGINYTTDEYTGIGVAARDDKTYDIRLGPTYLANRYVHVSLEYRYLQRESDDNTALLLHKEFDKNLLILQLNTQL